MRALTRSAIAAAIALSAALPAAAATQAAAAPSPAAPARPFVSAWLPYWASDKQVDAVIANADLITSISPFVYSARSATSIVSTDYGRKYAGWLGRLQDAGIPVYPSVTDGMAAGAMAAVLADPSTRSAHAKALTALVVRDGSDGIDLDYEKFAFADGTKSWPTTSPNWVAFVKELSVRLHAEGKKLSITIPPTYTDSPAPGTGYWVYAPKKIAPYADLIRIMAYDYSWSTAGPVAPASWVDGIVSTYMDPLASTGKVSLGVPTYGYSWVTARTGICPSTAATGRQTLNYATVTAILKESTTRSTFNTRAQELNLTYKRTYSASGKTCTLTRTGWYSNARAIANAARIAGNHEFRDISLWSLSDMDPAAWKALRSYAQSVYPVAPRLNGTYSPSPEGGTITATVVSGRDGKTPLAGVVVTATTSIGGKYTPLVRAATGPDGVVRLTRKWPASTAITLRTDRTWIRDVARTTVTTPAPAPALAFTGPLKVKAGKTYTYAAVATNARGPLNVARQRRVTRDGKTAWVPRAAASIKAGQSTTTFTITYPTRPGTYTMRAVTAVAGATVASPPITITSTR